MKTFVLRISGFQIAIRPFHFVVLTRIAGHLIIISWIGWFAPWASSGGMNRRLGFVWHNLRGWIDGRMRWPMN